MVVYPYQRALLVMLQRAAVYALCGPEEGAYITVRGVFDSYEENGYTIPRLTEAEMIAE